jgi:hypothetical protein
LTELTDRGVSHPEAVRIALEEFGDAVGLAAHFSRIAQTRKRRMIMRCTVASVMTLAAAVVVALCLWPDNHAARVIGRAVADSTDPPQTEEVQKNLDKLVKAAQELPDDLTAKTEAELNQFTEVHFEGMPLKEAITYIQEQLNDPHTHNANVQIYYDGAALKDADIDPAKTLVTIEFKHIRYKMLLELMLGQFNLGYNIRDGIMTITTKEKLDATLETRIYDCREILAVDTAQFRRPVAEHREKKQSETGVKLAAENPGTPSQAAKQPASAGFSLIQPRTPVDDLIDVITTSIAPPSWSEQGGPGTISEYDGLLVISQTNQVHSQVAELIGQISSKLAARPAKDSALETK